MNELDEMRSKFNDIYCGHFGIDERILALEERLKQYYRNTPHSMDNKTAYEHWRNFREWARIYGYTAEEINRAKRRIDYD